MEEEETKPTELKAEQESVPGPEQDEQPAAPAAGAEPGSLDQDGDELFVEMSQEEQKLAEANERYVRLLADFDNYRKRVRKEREVLRQSAAEDIALDLIPVIDNLERAVAAAKNDASDSSGSVLKGVELTLKLFGGALSRHGIERMSCIGEKFDPTRHEAVAQVASEDAEPETVIEEIAPGYTINGRIIRAPKVTVAATTPKTQEQAGEEE